MHYKNTSETQIKYIWRLNHKLRINFVNTHEFTLPWTRLNHLYIHRSNMSYCDYNQQNHISLNQLYFNHASQHLWDDMIPILLMNDRQTWAFEVPVQYTGPFVYMISGEIFYGQVTGVFANITGYCFHLYIQEWYSYKLNSWSRTTFWKLKITKSYKIKLYIILTIQ